MKTYVNSHQYTVHQSTSYQFYSFHKYTKSYKDREILLSNGNEQILFIKYKIQIPINVSESNLIQNCVAEIAPNNSDHLHFNAL